MQNTVFFFFFFDGGGLNGEKSRMFNLIVVDKIKYIQHRFSGYVARVAQKTKKTPS